MDASDMSFNELKELAFQDVSHFLHLIKTNVGLRSLRSGIGETFLHYLVVEDQVDTVRKLLEQGEDVEPVNNFSETPLMDAAALGLLEMMTLLLENGANPNKPSQQDGQTALHKGAEYQQWKALKLLQEAGGRMDLVDKYGDTPQSLAEDNL